MSRVAWLAGAASLVAACAAVLDFPDRELDTLDAGNGDGPNGSDAPNDTGSDALFEAGPPSATFSSSAIDFGMMPCGASSAATFTLKIQNNGGASLAWAATLSATTVFAIDGTPVGTIPPGGSADLKITSIPVPALAIAGETAKAVLAVATDDPLHASTVFTVARTAAGATIDVVPLTVSFGDTPPTIPASDVPIALRNVGNEPVTVQLGTLTDPSFTLSCDGGACPAGGTIVAPDASLAGLVAHFKPGDAGDFQATSAITLTGATCGTNPSIVTLTGKGSGSYASVQPGSLDFGMVDCGSTAGPKTFKVLNSGTDFNWTLVSAPTHYTVTMGGTAIVAGQPNLVAAGTSAIVTVTPNPIPGTSPVTPNYYGETLTITTDAVGDTDPHPIQLLMTAHGAILAQSAGTIPFGSVLVSGPPATFPFTVSNIGNASATVSYSVSDPAFAMAPLNQVVGGGGSYPATASFDPSAGIAYSATAQLSVAPGTVMCGDLPPPISLSGQGALSASVTSSVDFGLVDCNKTAAPQTVTLKNTGAMPFDWTAALANGTTRYTINPAAGKALAAGKTATITITPNKIPQTSSTLPDAFADSLSITTDPPLESPYVTSIHETARGAVLSFSPASIDFGKVRAGNSSGPTGFAVLNSGNAPATITLQATTLTPATNPNVFTVQTSPITVSTSTNDNTTFVVPGNAPSGRVYTGRITPGAAPTVVLCAPLPAPLSLTGQVK